MIAPDYEPFRSGTASGVLGGATVPPLKGFFMAIQLTPEELAKQRQRNEMAQALESWEKNLATKLAEDKIAKRKVTNPNKIKAYQQGAKQSSKKILKAFDDGMIF